MLDFEPPIYLGEHGCAVGTAQPILQDDEPNRQEHQLPGLTLEQAAMLHQEALANPESAEVKDLAV